MKGLPCMPYTANKAQQQTLQFGGVEYGKSGDDGALSESMNLSARQFPALSQRSDRAVFGTYEKATAIFGKGKLCVVDGTKFLYGGEEKGTVTEGEKQIVSINTKIVIWPDMVYYDTKEDKFGRIGDKVVIGVNKATFTENTLSVTETSDGRTLAEVFAPNQAVQISCTITTENNKELVIRGVEENTLTFSDNSFTPMVLNAAMTIERRVPELKVICASNNRLWGADDTTIWASALGDPLTWFNYDGLSTDSYSVAVGTDGPFTACCEYGSNVLFFKEDKLHKLIGSAPSEYAIYTYSIPGVQLGSMRSAQVINEVLYYKGVDGVYAYNGGVPYPVSENFGTRRFQDARAGNDSRTYYISMQDVETEEWGLWTLDTERGIWLREDDTHAIDFTTLDGEMMFLADEGKTVYRVEPSEGGERLRWVAQLYPMEETVHGKRGYSHLYLRYEMEPGAWMQVEIREDAAPFRKIGAFHGDRRRTGTITMAPGRCDTFQLRLSGEGRCVLKSLVRQFDVGSDV